MITIATFTAPESTVTTAIVYVRLSSGLTVRQAQSREATAAAAVREAVRMFRMTRADRKATQLEFAGYPYLCPPCEAKAENQDIAF